MLKEISVMTDMNDVVKAATAAGEVSEVPPINLPTKSPADYMERAKLELELRLNLRQEYEGLFQIWKNDAFADLEKKQDEVIAKGLKKYFEQWQEEQKPPEPVDIQKLLDQEYETFTIPVDYVKYGENGDETTHKVTFTLRELPQTVEKKFYGMFRGRLIDKLQDLESITQAGMEKSFEDRAKSFLSLFDESFDMLADAVLLCLNPFGKKRDIDREWVQNNIGSDRQWRIVEAQMKVNRLRDFFSKVSTSGRDMMMMKRPNFQALQTLAA
jgi:hypothetical protein